MANLSLISDYTLWELLSAPQAELASPCSVFDRFWLEPGLGLGKWLELRYTDKASWKCVSQALLATALAKHSYSLVLYIDSARTYSKFQLLTILKGTYQLPSSALAAALQRVLVFPCNSLEEMLLQVLSIRSFLNSRTKPVLLFLDNSQAYIPERDWSRGNQSRGQSCRSQLATRLYQQLKEIRSSCVVTLVIGVKEGNPKVVAEISTPFGAIKLWESPLNEGENEEFADKKWYLMEGISAPKYPDEVLFPLVQKGLTVAVMKAPWDTLLCEQIDMKTLGI